MQKALALILLAALVMQASAGLYGNLYGLPYASPYAFGFGHLGLGSLAYGGFGNFGLGAYGYGYGSLYNPYLYKGIY